MDLRVAIGPYPAPNSRDDDVQLLTTEPGTASRSSAKSGGPQLLGSIAERLPKKSGSQNVHQIGSMRKRPPILTDVSRKRSRLDQGTAGCSSAASDFI